jgi:hypothetical protein
MRPRRRQVAVLQDPRELVNRVRLVQELEPVGAVLGQDMALAGGQHHRQAMVQATDLPSERDAPKPGITTSEKTTSKQASSLASSASAA